MQRRWNKHNNTRSPAQVTGKVRREHGSVNGSSLEQETTAYNIRNSDMQQSRHQRTGRIRRTGRMRRCAALCYHGYDWWYTMPLNWMPQASKSCNRIYWHCSHFTRSSAIKFYTTQLYKSRTNIRPATSFHSMPIRPTFSFQCKNEHFLYIIHILN